MSGLDRFSYDGRDTTVAHCEWCRGEIYAGDAVKRIDDAGGFVHDNGECAEEYAMERVYDAEGTIAADGDIN